VRYARLDTLVRESDVICLALPLMEGSQALFGPERLKAMKPGAWLVNTARGAIVDRDALVEVIESGHLAGYAGTARPSHRLWHRNREGSGPPARHTPDSARVTRVDMVGPDTAMVRYCRAHRPPNEP